MITAYDVLPLKLIGDAFDLYSDVFAEIDGLAMQRHLMYEGEFYDVGTDKRITKWVSTTDNGMLTGLGVQTNDLWSWPLVSPRFFERQWPELYAADRIFYTGFVGVHPDAPVTTFRDLLEQMIVPITAVNGLAVMDFCAHNAVKRNLPQAVNRILTRLSPQMTAYDKIDQQEFWAYDFGAAALNA